ncbi:MAG: DUF4065 domain-containing protein [Spiroplasma sp.]|nr:DUF4065 domain-containing protein [Spiroplasma sp.]
MENKSLNLNDFVAFLLKTNENIQERINILPQDWEGLSNLKIQKLLYFIEASFLVKFNTKLFSQNFEAWDYGPVIPSLYQGLKKFERKPIFFDEFKKSGNYKNVINSLNEKQLDFLEESFIKFNKFSSFELVSLSHIYGPWKEVAKNEEITKQDMINFFHNINN